MFIAVNCSGQGTRDEGLGREAKRMATSQAAMMTLNGSSRGYHNGGMSFPTQSMFDEVFEGIACFHSSMIYCNLIKRLYLMLYDLVFVFMYS
jgi:hypothetical protein